ncbi:MAG: DUF3090 family protein [Anaerolineae bacterium]|nr:DUF3090 family protein [Anaerolineae bacterium]
MPTHGFELDPVDFVTIGTIGPKGRRRFHLQAGSGSDLVTLIIEKEQARALSDAINEILENLGQQFPDISNIDVDLSQWDMTLRDPVEPLFRVAQIGLGYDEDREMILLVAQEMITIEEDVQALPDPQEVRLWASCEQMRALSEHAMIVVKQGRANPKSNGHMIYYWT